jgi:hypothetical protein
VADRHVAGNAIERSEEPTLAIRKLAALAAAEGG